MSIAAIISQDITLPIALPSNRSELGPREQMVIKAYESEPFLSKLDSRSKIVDQKLIRVENDLLFQILLVENISTSTVSQLDDIKAKTDPKTQKVDRLRQTNYKVITQVDIDDTDNDGCNNFKQNGNSKLPLNSKNNTYKITLQSKSRSIFFAINSAPLPWASCMLGSKIIVKSGTLFNRGVFLLQESQVIFLGGINRIWNENKDEKISAYLHAKLDVNNELVNNQNSKKRKSSSLS